MHLDMLYHDSYVLSCPFDMLHSPMRTFFWGETEADPMTHIKSISIGEQAEVI